MLWALIHLLLGTGFTWRGKELFLRAPEEFDNVPFLPTPQAAHFDRSASVAVLPEAQPAFLGSRNVLFANELRFRQLLNDVYHSETKELVRTYVDGTGGIAPVQLKCRIVECKRLATGQAIYIIEGLERVSLDQVWLEGSDGQYLVGNVSPLPDIDDDDGQSTKILALEVYSMVKTYLRLARRVPTVESAEDPESSRYLCLSPAIVNSWNAQDFGTFSHAVANLVSTTPAIMHQLFTASVSERLRGLTRILTIALDDISNDLIGQEVMTSIDMDIVKDRGANVQDFADLLPPLDFQELTLDGIEIEFEEDVIDEIKVREGPDLVRDDGADEDDLWGSKAFQ